MRPHFGMMVVVVSSIVIPFEVRSQSCDTAMVQPNGYVLIRWCCPTTPTINFFGTSVQRRNELDPNFWEVPQSTCTCPSPTRCSFVDTTVSVGAWYYRIREIDLDGTVAFRPPMRVEVSPPVSVKETVPMQFSLGQNYPNPFNPTTTIRFELPSSQIVQLTVFNLLGQEVARLAEGRYAAGVHSVNADFHALPSGVYMYRLRAGAFVDVKKLLVVK
jgi:hypothetical protein